MNKGKKCGSRNNITDDVLKQKLNSLMNNFVKILVLPEKGHRC